MKKWDDLKKELLQKKQVAKEYEKLEPKYKLIGDLIEARLKKGLTQKQLAEKIGTKQSAIARVESGNTNVSFDFLVKLTNALDTKLTIRVSP